MLRVRFWRKKNFYLLWPFAAIISGGILLWLYMLGNSLHVVRKLNEPRVIPGHVRQLTSSRDRALIVWWNMMPESYNDTISLEHGSCQVSGDRRLWKEANVRLIYLIKSFWNVILSSNLNVFDCRKILFLHIIRKIEM